MRFKEQTARDVFGHLKKTIEIWDNLTSEDKEHGCYINPDEPLVLAVPNPEYDAEQDEDDCGQDDNGEYERIFYHVESIGGGYDEDEDGVQTGHEGFQISGFEMDYYKFLYQGRRRDK